MSPTGRRGLTRRGLVGGLAVGAVLLPAARWPAAAESFTDRELHGLSIFGDLKYPVDFTHFDYVDPAAPKGGKLLTVPSSWSLNQNPGTFNTFNSLILKGDAPVGMTMIFDTLMTRALDEPDAVYGLVAKSVRIADAGQTYIFTLRPEARFHDGSRLTAADVAFSLTTLKEKGHPSIAETINKQMLSAEADGDDKVIVRFTPKRSRGLPLIVANLPILSKAYYTAHNFEETSLEPPLGSSAYKVGRFEPGRFVEYERVADYWAKDLPVNVGQNNFQVIRYDVFRERTVAFEAFKAGQYLLREEFTSAVWNKQYDFPAVADKRVVKLELEDRSPSGAQGWFLNMRRPHFKDARVREAIGLAFDFEWSNRNLFFGSYTRTQSYFENSDLKATGKPPADELALLEKYRDKLPAEAFGEPWSPPVSDGSGRDRALLKRASQLLTDAGWTLQDGKLRNAGGEVFALEFLDDEPSFERVMGPFIQNLKAIGIDATYRVVDPAQFQSRLDGFDFDALSRRYSLSPTPDEDIRQFWHSSTADQHGSQNLAGIKDPVIDALIELILAAETRAELSVAARALDRVLRAGRYWVPHWYKPSHWIALWDVYAAPKIKPRYDRGIVATWWVDADKAAKLGKGM